MLPKCTVYDIAISTTLSEFQSMYTVSRKNDTNVAHHKFNAH